jgi:hypothetical protein
MVPLLLTELPYTVGVFTQEVRLLSQVSNRFRLITGVYYLQDTLDEGFLQYPLLGGATSTTWKDSQQAARDATPPANGRSYAKNQSAARGQA